MDKQRRRKLPTGIQNFREIRETDCYYVDKTAYAGRLAAEGKHWFLSRPRRFGKSLFVDTLKELFEGSEALFEGLAIHKEWDWSVRHPVVRISFAGGSFNEPDGLKAKIDDILITIEDDAGVVARHATASSRLAHVIRTLHERTGQKAVVLVDEYDKPILDALDKPEVATANRDYLRGLYGTLKDSDAHIRLSFITGVSKFSKVSLFSSLNQIEDITLERTFSGICGFTETDLAEVFAQEIASNADLFKPEMIRDWYNGYCWRGPERLYNPVSILRLFRRREYENGWFETATPTFLVNTLMSRGRPPVDLESMTANNADLSKFDVGDIGLKALLFQTGYLTITREKVVNGQTFYTLGYPNREVRQNLHWHLLQVMRGPKTETAEDRIKLERILTSGDTDGLKALLKALLAGVPSDWYRKTPIAKYEGWYVGMVYAYLMGAGYQVPVEDATNHGRIDLALPLPGIVWIFEFKVAGRGSAGKALQQIIDRGYAEKYRDGRRRIVLVGVEVDEDKRNLVAFETAEG